MTLGPLILPAFHTENWWGWFAPAGLAALLFMAGCISTSDGFEAGKWN